MNRNPRRKIYDRTQLTKQAQRHDHNQPKHTTMKIN